MTAQTDEELNVRLAELCGIEPRKSWRFFYDKERQHGTIKLPTREKALMVREHNRRCWPGLYDSETVSEPEEYDDWDDAPRYCSDLNEVARVEAGLTDDIEGDYRDELKEICLRDWIAKKIHSPHVAYAPARQRTEALIATLTPTADALRANLSPQDNLKTT